jgi:hypothetical protein
MADMACKSHKGYENACDASLINHVTKQRFNVPRHKENYSIMLCLMVTEWRGLNSST